MTRVARPTGTSAAARLAARDLRVRYVTRRAHAVDGVSLAIAAGERVLLAGPSGSGKSTLALCLAGLIPSAVDADVQGAAEVDGTATDAYAPGALAERVGTVFQDPTSQFTMLSVEDEVAFGLENLGVDPAEMPARVRAALAAVGLADRATWRLDRLSGGQQQRVAVAAALAMRPHTLVLDEPSAHLDPLSARELYAAVAGIAGSGERTSGEVTLVLVEHTLDLVVPDLVERAIVLRPGGTLAADGSVARLFADRGAAERLADLGTWLPAPTRLGLLLGARSLPLSVEDAARWLAADGSAQAALRLAALRQAALRQAALRQAAAEAPGGRAAPGEVVLCARGLSQVYATPTGAHQALWDVDVEVRAGELVALVGASGSGKSSLLRALAGLLPLARGTLRVGDVELRTAGARQLARLVGLVFQQPESGFVADSVAEVMAYGPRALGWPEAAVRARVADTLERYGLVALARANPYTLSEGQKRRLSVAAALVLGPRVLLLDEPTFGQDPHSAAALMREIAALRENGVGVVFATHDLPLAAEWADRLVALRAGRVLFDGSPAAFVERPNALHAAGQEPPPLARIAAGARALGAWLPAAIRWTDVELAGRRRLVGALVPA